MQLNAIDRYGMDTMEAVSCLVAANHYLQALVVLYSAIDTLAWSDLPEGDVTGTDFCQWVEMYMHPEETLGCTAKDLYGARCAILHSSAAESRMSRRGAAHELWYVTSPHSLDRARERIDETGAPAKVVYFTALVATFSTAVMDFSRALILDSEHHQRSSDRVQRWLRFQPMQSLAGETSET